jgi:aryl-alcohol dehydrogenase-like predicted oxidoreductase
MKKVELGNTGEQISCMGLGTMYFGTKVDEQTSFRILDFYAEMGGSFLDSANKYASWVPEFQGGESEKLIGKWMKEKGNRNDLFITSKVGFPYGEIPRSLKKEIVVSECEKSLKRMGVETIDLYFAHAFDDATPTDETMEAFFQLKKSGKIRLAGASNFYGWQLSEANGAASRQGWEGFCCLQQRHTYLESGLRSNFGTQLVLTPEIQKLCADRKITMMGYSPLLGGAYVRDEREIPVQYQSVANEFRLTILGEVANELQVSANAVVLAWMIQSSPGIIPLVTGSTVEQIKENLIALLITLSKENMERLNGESVQPNKYS